jgi:hypothetical protein
MPGPSGVSTGAQASQTLLIRLKGVRRRAERIAVAGPVTDAFDERAKAVSLVILPSVVPCPGAAKAAPEQVAKPTEAASE